MISMQPSEAQKKIEPGSNDTDIVSPFAIKNLTDKAIQVYNLQSDYGKGSGSESGQKAREDDSFVIKPLHIKNLKLSLAE